MEYCTIADSNVNEKQRPVDRLRSVYVLLFRWRKAQPSEEDVLSTFIINGLGD